MNAYSKCVLAAAVALVGGLAACQNPSSTSAEASAVEPDRPPLQKVGGDESATEEAKEKTAAKPKLENLLRAPLADNDQFEVIVSRVQIPANTALPRHYHPGQEFVYVVSGSASLVLDGEEVKMKPGEAGVVPARAHHLARTGDEAVDVVVFRVHDPNKPIRILVDEEGNELESKPQ